MRQKQSNHINDSRVAQEVTRMVNGCEKSQYDISVEMGLQKSNFITMIKQGRTKVPLDKVVPLARACGEDPAKLMLLCIEEYQPALIEALGEAFRATISEEESAIMRSIRHARQVKEQAKQTELAKKAKTKEERRLAGLARVSYDTSPESLKALYAFALKNLIH